jgi:hypothetical protein
VQESRVTVGTGIVADFWIRRWKMELETIYLVDNFFVLLNKPGYP